jgi:hypothetical protein
MLSMRLRFRIRSLLIAAAVIAIVLGLRFHSRAMQLREHAKKHRQLELLHSALGDVLGRCGCGGNLDELLTIEITPAGADVRPKSECARRILELRKAELAARKQEHRRISAYHARCARLLECAAWLTGR